MSDVPGVPENWDLEDMFKRLGPAPKEPETPEREITWHWEVTVYDESYYFPCGVFPIYMPDKSLIVYGSDKTVYAIFPPKAWDCLRRVEDEPEEGK